MLLSVLSVLLDHVNVLSCYIGLGSFTVLHHVHQMMIHIVLTWLKNGCASMVSTLTGLGSKLEGVDTLNASQISRFNLILELILNEYQSPPSFLQALIQALPSAFLQRMQTSSEPRKSNIYNFDG